MKRQLHSPRLLLRPPQPGDERAAYASWAQDVEVLRYLGWLPHTQLSQTKAQLDWDLARWLKRSAWTWLLVPTTAGVQHAPIGLVQLLPQQLDGHPHHLRLGYLLARSHWRRGLMQEALGAVLAEAFEQPAVSRIDALCDVANPASMQLLLALGFQPEGVLRQHSVHPNLSKSARDVAVYARVREAG
jgi:[ribosomal protein S5]-alanine N-acetyltransferase